MNNIVLPTPEKLIQLNTFVEKVNQFPTGKVVEITLPDIKAVSRNDTTGHYFNYKNQLNLAEKWMATFGKRFEYHFNCLVDVDIKAYYDTRGRHKCADTPNIDDKIFTDILVRWKQSKHGKASERSVWFIEDDNHKHLHIVTKEAIPSNGYKVIITIKECNHGTM